jgi:hypothetical protein
MSGLSLLVAFILAMMPTGCGSSRKASAFKQANGDTEYIVYSRLRPTVKMEHDAPTLLDQDQAMFHFPAGQTVLTGADLDRIRIPNHGTVKVEGDKIRVDVTLGNGKPHPMNGEYPIVDGKTNKPIGK